MRHGTLPCHMTKEADLLLYFPLKQNFKLDTTSYHLLVLCLTQPRNSTDIPPTEWTILPLGHSDGQINNNTVKPLER